MKLLDYEHCSLIKDFFSPAVIAGFTKDSLTGRLPQDIGTALSFLDQEFKLTYLKQVHSAEIIFSAQEGIYQGDALFTQEKNLVLLVRTADCLPLFFASEKLGLVGVLHLGWRSAKAGILDNLTYDLASFKVTCGVGLRKCCYEVGEEFLDYPSLAPFIEKRSRGGVTPPLLYYNPVEFSRKKLESLGLKNENFSDLNICSFCNPVGFFSFRRDKTSSRTLSFVLKI